MKDINKHIDNCINLTDQEKEQILNYFKYDLPTREIWKEIKGYDGFYEVSNLGRVRSYHTADGTGGRKSTPTILTPVENHNGYFFIGLHKDGEQKCKRLNRLIGEYFVPNPDNKRFVNHKLGIKAFNWAVNLEWCTQSENELHAYKNGLKTIDHLRGNNHPVSKLTENNVLDIRNAYALGCFTYEEIAKAFNVSQSAIGKIIKRKAWAHI